MVNSVGRWVLTGAVAAALVGGTSGATLRAQKAPEPNEPAPEAAPIRLKTSRKPKRYDRESSKRRRGWERTVGVSDLEAPR